jgi:uncharacterized protein
LRDVLTALALVLVIEGALYALAPGAMRRMMVRAQELPEAWLSRAGLAAAAAGVFFVWLIRG